MLVNGKGEINFCNGSSPPLADIIFSGFLFRTSSLKVSNVNSFWPKQLMLKTELDPTQLYSFSLDWFKFDIYIFLVYF